MTQILAQAGDRPGYQSAFGPHTAGQLGFHHPDLDPSQNVWPALVDEVPAPQLIVNIPPAPLINLTVRLRRADGTTLVVEAIHSDIGDEIIEGSITLSGGEADSIPSADYAAGLVAEFSADT